MRKPKRLFYLESLGCAKNQVESERLLTFLERYGLQSTSSPCDAELIIVNSCGFIKSACEESIELSLNLKREFPQKKIILTGCLALRYGERLKEAMPELTVIDARFSEPLFKHVLLKALGLREGTFQLDFNRTHLLSYAGSAYVKIADGCNNCCSYCTIPKIRGPLQSRPQAEILSEVKDLLKRGIKEIVLISQDTASYGLDRGCSELQELLLKLASLSGNFWIRLLYLHPDRIDQGIIQTICSSEKIIPYFDLPFQHASHSILTAMNRTGKAKDYLELVSYIRRLRPEAIIRTTLMLGFPGETEEDFRQLLFFQQKLKPNWAGFFIYSNEEGTPASRLKPKVPKYVALKRLKLIQERQVQITSAWLDSLLGQRLEILLEEEIKEEGLSLGRAFFQAPDVDSVVVITNPCRQPGSLIRASLTKRIDFDLEASCEKLG